MDDTPTEVLEWCFVEVETSKLFQCDHCGKNFKLKYNLSRHVKTHRRPAALAKLSVPTHHLSLFRIRWRLKILNVLVLNIAEKLLARRQTPINQSINQSILGDRKHTYFFLPE